MNKAREIQAKVASALNRAAQAIGRNDEEIHWSTTKKKFVKANNKTVATEAQVRQHLQSHPDELTYQQAVIHLGPGLPRPMITQPDVNTSAQTEIAQLVASIEEYRAGTHRDSQQVLSQTEETLRQLSTMNQLIEEDRQKLIDQGLLNNRLSKSMDEIQDNILQIFTQLKDQSDAFGSVDEKFAESVAFNERLEALFRTVQQQLEDLRLDFGNLHTVRQEEHNFASFYPSGIGLVGCLLIFGAVIASIVIGLTTVYLIPWDEGVWLGIMPADLGWGLVAGLLVFITCVVLIWSAADSDLNEHTARTTIRGG